MRFKFVLVFCLLVLVGILSGCSSDVVLPEEPASATGTTDATGIADITTGPFTVEVSVVNSALSPVAGANVACYLMHEHLLTIASFSSGSYYPGLVVTDLADAQSGRRDALTGPPDRPNSAKVARETKITVEVIVYNASLAAYGYDEEIENYDMIQSDSWTTETTQTMDMQSFYSFMDTVEFNGSVFVHLNSDLSTTLGAGRKTASFLLGQISSFEAFSSLMSWELRIFSGDTATVTTMTYQDEGLPLMNISGIAMNRDFWLQFTLTWGQDPWDLDSHLFTPEIPGNYDTVAYHVYYASPGNAQSAPFADLDVDDVTSYGPEHITIWQEFPGTYSYAVYHYSGTGTIVTSGAEVGVLKPDGTLQSFTVPENGSAASNYWWHVCNIDGETGVITPVDTIAASTPGYGFNSAGGQEVMPPKNNR